MAWELPDDLERQAHIVSSYGQWPEATFRRAAVQWLHLAASLGAADQGRLGEEANANIVRAVSLANGTAAVLKVTVASAPNESDLLRAYASLPHLSVPLLADGITPGGHSWTLTQLLEGHEPPHPLEAETVRAATRVAKRARNVTGSLERATGKRWAKSQDGLLTSLRKTRPAVLRLLTPLSPQEPERVLDSLERIAASCCMVMAHGDLRSRNTILTPSGQLILLDPVGLVGPPETDMSTWIAIAAARSLTDPVEAVRVATTTDTELGGKRLLAWTTIRVLLLAAEEPETGFLRQDPENVAAILKAALERLTRHHDG